MSPAKGAAAWNRLFSTQFWSFPRDGHAPIPNDRLTVLNCKCAKPIGHAACWSTIEAMVIGAVEEVSTVGDEG